MSEYIVTTEQLNWFLERMDETVAIPAAIAHLKPIVRCRDCTYYDDEPDLESSMPKCWRDPDHHGTAIWTPPDGFCAWGEQKVVSE